MMFYLDPFYCRFNQHNLNIIKAQTNLEKEKLLDEIAANNPNSVPNGEVNQDITPPKSKKVSLSNLYHHYHHFERLHTCLHIIALFT